MEISRGDDDGVNVFASVEFVVIASLIRPLSAQFVHIVRTFCAAAIPDVRKGREFNVQFLCMLEKGKNQCRFHAIAAGDDADAYTIVGADYAGIAGRGK